MKKFKMALIVPDLFVLGGLSNVANFIYKAAQRDGRFEIKVISLENSARSDLSVCLTKPKTWLTGIKIQQKIWLGRRVYRLGCYFSEFEFLRYQPRNKLNLLISDCNFIQFVSGSPAQAFAISTAKVPKFLQVATLVQAERKMGNKKKHSIFRLWSMLMTLITSYYDVKSLSKMNLVQVENSWMFKYVGEKIQNQNVLLSYNPPGVDTNLFVPLLKRNLSKKTSYILSVARFDDPRKNPNLLLKSFSILPNEVLITTKLILAGTAPPPEDFWDQVKFFKLEKSVQFVLRPSSLSLLELYQNADIFALSSDEEGFGLVIIESFACGIPVVSTKSGGPDGIIRNGFDGYLVDKEDEISFSNALFKLLENKEANMRMGRNARRKAENKYGTALTERNFIRNWDYFLRKS